MAEIMNDIAHLTQDIGPHPAGTEEEQQAALYLAEKMQNEAGFSTIIEDFQCVTNDQVPRLVCFGVALAATFIALVFPAASWVCLLLGIVAAGLFAAEIMGRPVVSRFLRTGASQNVVAKYQPAQPQGSTARRRKVILVANYDSGKVLMEEKPPIAGFLPYLQKASAVALVAAPVLLFLRTALFAGEANPVGSVLSVLMLVCLALFVLPVVRSVLHIMAPYNQSANNNAAGAAVLTQVARMVGRGLVSNEELEARAQREGSVVHGEAAARAAGVVPEGVELEYETAQSSQESLAAAKAAIAALTGKPVADKIPVTDISARLVKGGGLDPQDEEQASSVHFEVGEKPQLPPREELPRPFARTMVSMNDPEPEPEPEQEQPAAQQEQPSGAASLQPARSLSEPAAPVRAMAAPAPAPMPAGEAFVPALSGDRTPAWAKAAQAKARANKPEASQPRKAGRSQYADTPAAHIIDAQAEAAHRRMMGEEVAPDLSSRLAALRSEIASAEAPQATDGAPAAQPTDQAASEPVAPHEQPASASEASAAVEPVVERPQIEGAFVRRAPIEPDQPVEPEYRMPEPAETAAAPARPAATLEHRTLDGRGQVARPSVALASEPVAEKAEEPALEVDGFDQVPEHRQMPENESYEREAAEEESSTERFQAVDSIPAEPSPVASAPKPRHRGVSLSQRAKEWKSRVNSMTARFSKPAEDEEQPIEGGYHEDGHRDYDQVFEGAHPNASEPEGIEEEQSTAAFEPVEGASASPQAESPAAASPAATSAIAPIDVSAFLDKEQFDDEPLVVARPTQPKPLRSSFGDSDRAEEGQAPEAQNPEAVYRPSTQDTAPASPIVGMEGSVEAPMATANRPERQVIVLPDVVSTHAADAGRQRAPMAEASSSVQAGSKSLLSNMLPSIDAFPEDASDAASSHVSGTSTGELPQAVSATGSFSTVGATGSFAPVGDELVADVDPDERYIDDADDSAYDEDYTETGAYAGQGYVEMPKSRAGRLFGRLFGGRKKNKEEDLTVAEWVDVDESYDARSVGQARGDWSSFREENDGSSYGKHAAAEDQFVDVDYQDDYDDRRGWKGGAFSLNRLRKGEAAVDQDVYEPSGDAAIDSDEAYVAENPSVRLDGDFDTAEEINRELRKLQEFRHPDIDTEVWFVALGAELYSHSGINAFIEQHADELKGATIVNLEALGAGTLSASEVEGAYRSRRPSSRMKRALRQAADRSGVTYHSAALTSRDSTAAVAMNHGLAAFTICGMAEGNTALYAADNDVIENMDEAQLNDAAKFVFNFLKSI